MTEYTFVVTQSLKKEWTITTRANSLNEAETQARLHGQYYGPPRGAVITVSDQEVMAVETIPSHLS